MNNQSREQNHSHDKLWIYSERQNEGNTVHQIFLRNKRWNNFTVARIIHGLSETTLSYFFLIKTVKQDDIHFMEQWLHVCYFEVFRVAFFSEWDYWTKSSWGAYRIDTKGGDCLKPEAELGVEEYRDLASVQSKGWRLIITDQIKNHDLPMFAITLLPMLLLFKYISRGPNWPLENPSK